jgi:hypothetical protein
MPQVPTYDSFQVAPQAAPDVHVADVQPGDNALQLGKALSSAGADFTDSAIRLQHQQNADRIFQAEASVKNDYVKFETDAKSRQGQDAWGLTQSTTKWWNDNLKKTADALENDQQREVFLRTTMPIRDQSLTTMGAYEQQQRQISVEESGKASITGSINLAASNPTNLGVINGAKSDILKRVQVLGDLNGWTPEIREAQAAQYVTNLHKQVIQSQIDTNPDAARAYYDANKAEIQGADRDEIDKQIRVGTIRQVGQQASDAIMQQGLGESQALATARSKFTGAQQDEVVRRVKERYADIDMVRERGQKDAADRAWQQWSKDKSLSNIPTSVLNSMDGKDRDALQATDSAHASGKDIQTDWSTFYDLRQQASVNPAGFAQTDIRRYFPQLNPAQREQLIDTQNQVKGQGANDVQTLNEQLGRAHELLGWSASDGQKKGQFDSAALTAIDAAQKANGGKKLSYDDRQKVVDRMMVTGSYPGGNWFSPDRFYSVAGTEKESKFAPKVPDDERAKIEAALTRAKQPVTDDAVMKLYKLKNGLP